MRLRTRLFFAFALTAALPVGIVGYLGRDYFLRELENGRDDTRKAVSTFMRAFVDQRLDAEIRRVEPVCQGERLVDEVLDDLHRGRADAGQRAAVQEGLGRVLRERDLDFLEIVASDDRVIASSRGPGNVGRRDPGAFRRAIRNPDATVETRPVRGEDVPVVVASCVASDFGIRVAIVGGRRLVRVLPERRDPSGAATLVLLDGRGRPLLDHDAKGLAGGFERVPVIPASADGPSLAVIVSDARVKSALGRLDLFVGAMAIAVVLLAGLLSVVLAGRITSPLSHLAEGASAVANGDLDVRIGIRTGGEIGELVGAFNRMTEDLARTRARMLRAERVAAWREIARRIAHEIKNPLSPIQTSVETLRKAKRQNLPEFDEIFEESARTILEEVGRLKRIVTEFSQFARMPRPRPATVEVRDVLAHAVGLHAGGEVEVSLEPAPPLPPIRADREQLTQVLVNLLQNAIEACRGRPGGSVAVSARPEGEGVEVAVRDTGAGIDTEAQEHLFEPYYTTKSEGTGLGLAIVHRIVTDHAGRIDVSSRPGEGTTVRLWLPLGGPPPAATDSGDGIPPA